MPLFRKREAMAALVVGLGNPGPEYAATRHNVGHMVVAELARRAGASLSATKHHALAASVRLGTVGGAPGPAAVIATPLSYMNVSGGPVAGLARFYNVPAAEVIVIHDELDLPYGTVKLKRGGGAGGHNGIKDVTKALGGPEFVRVRAGVGRPPGRQDPAAFVLKPFSATERKELPWVIDTCADAVEMIVAEGLEAAQMKFHTSD